MDQSASGVIDVHKLLDDLHLDVLQLQVVCGPEDPDALTGAPGCAPPTEGGQGAL